MLRRVRARSSLALLLAGCAAVAAGCGSHGAAADSGAIDAGPDGPPACTDPPKDTDGDGISDADEGAAIRLDTDGDGIPDYKDLDSDDDGIPDAVEAGDTNLCTPPRDADGDGIPDFRDMDSDGNGIPDKIEGGGDNDHDGIVDADDLDDDNDTLLDRDELAPGKAEDVDTDGDGLVDRFDTDADGDGIPDAVELDTDRDNDLVPNQRDLDSDGDCIPDALEAGPDPTHPLNTDGDAWPDFLDFDSDDDGIPDKDEDVNCNGVVDPGESDPRKTDTDGDGYPDVVERAAGTSPADPKSRPSPDDFFFVLPYQGPSQQAPLDFQTDIVKADLLLQVDTTGSMGAVVHQLQDSLIDTVLPGAAKAIPNLAECVSSFQDFPVAGFGGCGGGGAQQDAPFRLGQRCAVSVQKAAAAVDKLNKPMGCGGDDPEAGFEALYQAATGEGISWDGGAVPKFDPSQGFDATLDMGPLGGVGFRDGALPIIVHVTDTVSHDKPDYAGFVDGAHSKADAMAALDAAGARVIGISVGGGATGQLEEMARFTGAMVPPLEAFPQGGGLCMTGIGGATRSPVMGLCPLVFEIRNDGTGLATAVVDAIRALAFLSVIDVSGRPVGDPAKLPDVDTARFIKRIAPVPPAPPGATVDAAADVFRHVKPSSPVRFSVEAQNDFVLPMRQLQLFQLTIQVLGDNVTVLDQRRVYVIVPPSAGPG